MKLPRMTLSALFRKQSASEETEETIVDPTNPEETTAAGAEESETVTEETVTDSVTETETEQAPTNVETEVTDPATETVETSASAESGIDYQALAETLRTELNLFGSTIEARAAFRTEASRNKGFIEAMKNVGVISEEDATTTAEQNTGRKSYENAPWNQSAIAKRN